MRKHILVVFAIPLLFVGLAIGYNPFDMLSKCDFGVFTPQVHIVMLGCVLMVNLLISRVIYFFVERVIAIGWWQDLIWCLLETFFAAFFLALYMALFGKKPYFEMVGRAFQYIYALLLQPYVIVSLIEALVKSSQGPKHSDDQDNVIHFYDENKHLKLVINASTVLFIKADDNSVRINYTDSGKVKVFVLRTSMRKLEPLAEKYNLVRCQRSYYVNPTHVKILRKDKEGFIYADLGMEGVESIPVSKTYYNNLASIM